MKAVIFDMDGTLLDTLEDLADSLNHTLALHGFPERTLDEVRSFVGNGAQTLVRRALPEASSEETVQMVLNDYRAYYNDHADIKTGPYDGILQVLEELGKRGIAVAIVSNKPDASVKKLNKTYFGDRIPVAIGESSAVEKKPAPDTVIKAANELGVELRDCIYVGDSDVDIQTAKNCKIPCISVTWGFRGREFLKKNGGSIFAKDGEELLTQILRLSGATQTSLEKFRRIVVILLCAELMLGAACIASLIPGLMLTGTIKIKSVWFVLAMFFSIFSLKNIAVLLVLKFTSK